MTYNGEEKPTIFVKEAETLDKSEVKAREDFKNLGIIQDGDYVVEGFAGTSGGQKIHGFGAGTKFNVNVKVASDCTVDVILALWSDQTQTMGENFKFYLDGELIEISNPNESMTPNSLHDVTPLENLELSAGDHVFTIEVVVAHFDFDCIKFISRTTINANNIQFDVVEP